MVQLQSPQQERGQGLVEYALVLVLIAVVVIAILTLLGPKISVVYAQVIGGLSDGQTITKSGAEVIVAANADRVQAGNFCTVGVRAGTTVIALQDGMPIPDATVSVTIYANGVSGGSTTAVTNQYGVGTLAADIEATDFCPAGVSYSLTP